MFIDGNLQINYPVGSYGLTFPVGDVLLVGPFQLTLMNNLGVGGIVVSTSNVEHPNVASSNIDPSKSVNRNWRITNNGATFDQAFIGFNWDATEVDGIATPSNFVVGKYNAPQLDLSECYKCWRYFNFYIRHHFFQRFCGGRSISRH